MMPRNVRRRLNFFAGSGRFSWRAIMKSPASANYRARYEQGIVLRRKTPREAHAALNNFPGRNPVALLGEGDKARVPELVPERYKRMLVSPFTFLRGAATVMAQDLAHTPRAGITVQGCGDCHLMNFGAFATPEEIILFDINDFDETLPGVDFTVDLKRLAASVAVAGQDAKMPGKRARAAAAATVEAYRLHMRTLAKLTPLEIWHSRIELPREVKHLDDPALRRRLQAILHKAGRQLERDDNFPHLVKGDKIADKRPTIYHFDRKTDPRERVDPQEVFAAYRKRLTPERLCLFDRYTLKDTAFKAVGVGSVGTFCAVSLFVTGDGAPLFLQFKEARKSALECLGPKFSGHPGRRVVEGQRTMQAASDIFLGWTEDEISGRHFYVRQLKNRRLGSIGELVEENALVNYARLCGRTLARAHARSGDAAMIAGYLGRSEAMANALGSFAMAYAKRTKRDYDLLEKAKGQLAAKA
jgi:uncharacterized protein (DUF2252 family)